MKKILINNKKTDVIQIFKDIRFLLVISTLFIFFSASDFKLFAEDEIKINQSNKVVKAYCFEGTGEGSFFIGKGYSNRTVHFIACTDGKAWKIRVNLNVGNLSFYESGSLGGTNNVYTTSEYPFLYLLKDAAKNPNVNLNIKGILWVERIPVPIIEDSCPFMAVIWYALCSADYLNSVKDYKWIIPPYEINNVRNYALLGLTNVRSILIRSQLTPGLPEIMRFIHNGRLWKNTGEIQYPDEFGSGFTNALFLAESFLSIGEYHYPQEFGFLIQEPINDPEKTAGKLMLATIKEMHFVVTNAQIIEMSYSDFIPQPKVLSGCHDLRFINSEKPMMYLSYITNRWLSESEVMELPKYKEALRRMAVFKKAMPTNIQKFGLFPKKPEASASKKMVLMSIILIVFLMPILVFMLRKSLYKTNKKN